MTRMLSTQSKHPDRSVRDFVPVGSCPSKGVARARAGRGVPLGRSREAERAVGQTRTHAIDIRPYPASQEGGGSGNSGGNGPPSSGGKTDQFDPEEAQQVEEVLIKEALAEGNFSKKDARAWLQAWHIPLIGYLAGLSPALRDRLMGNPRFLLTVAVELLVGCTAKLIAEQQARGERFWAEADFVASDLALEVFCDISTVWLLSPRASFAHAPTGGPGKVLAGLPAHCLQMGAFTPAQRLGTLLLRGTQFGVTGFFAAALGHSLTVRMVEHKRKLAKAERESAWEAALAALPAPPPRWQFWRKAPRIPESLRADPVEPALAPVLENSLGWGSFSAVSVQLRYQAVNALEERLFASVIKGGTARSVTSFAVRFLNSVVGGTMWIWYARRLGLQ